MDKKEAAKNDTRMLSVQIDSETLERLEFLAKRESSSVEEVAARLLAVEAEAEAGLTRGPRLRKYLYR